MVRLFALEDSAAVLQMKHKGGRSNLRHVTRTHRVNLACLFERICLDPSNRVCYVRTCDLFADQRYVSRTTMVTFAEPMANSERSTPQRSILMKDHSGSLVFCQSVDVFFFSTHGVAFHGRWFECIEHQCATCRASSSCLLVEIHGSLQ